MYGTRLGVGKVAVEDLIALFSLDRISTLNRKWEEILRTAFNADLANVQASANPVLIRVSSSLVKPLPMAGLVRLKRLEG
jgi:hypothetical protein